MALRSKVVPALIVEPGDVQAVLAATHPATSPLAGEPIFAEEEEDLVALSESTEEGGEE
jgi:hypothetical protein